MYNMLPMDLTVGLIFHFHMRFETKARIVLFPYLVLIPTVGGLELNWSNHSCCVWINTTCRRLSVLA